MAVDLLFPRDKKMGSTESLPTGFTNPPVILRFERLVVSGGLSMKLPHARQRQRIEVSVGRDSVEPISETRKAGSKLPPKPEPIPSDHPSVWFA